jgi:putative peptide zinc metalloprotease protein
MFLTPAPYVDASAANSFVRRSNRVVVSAAGIMTELLLAAFAVGVWLLVQPGVVRDTALATLLICSVSTLLFNGNPLLRMDGYYVLSDALDLPNLAARSKAWWTAWAYRLARGPQSVPSATLAAGELKWLVFYAPASWLFRLGLFFALVTWIGSKSWLLGWTVALGLLGWLALRGSSFVLKLSDGFSQLRTAALAWGALAVFVLALGLFVVPVPSIVVARGVVWPPEGAQVRPEMAGIVTQTLAANGTVVQAGDLLLALADPALTAERDRRVSQLAGLQAQQYLALMKDPVKAADIAEDIARSEAEIARAEQQLAQLMVRSQSRGRLVLSSLDDLPGSHAARGAMLGYIVGDDAANVRVVLDEQDILLVRNRIRKVEVRLADLPTRPLAGRVDNEAPAATRKLPSSALGERHGGDVLVDPGDKDGLRTLAPVFLVDIKMPGYAPDRIGGRAWVRFDLGFEPAGLQLARRLRQLLLHDFNPLGQA